MSESLRPGKGALLPAACPGSGLLLRYFEGGGFDGGTWLPPVTSSSSQQQAQAVLWLENRWNGWAAYRYDWFGEPAPFLACAEAPGSRHNVAAGSVVRLLGSRIGPESPVDLPTGENGRLSTSVQGVGATIRGRPMPILQGDANTVEVLVPQAAAAVGEPVRAELRLAHLDTGREFQVAAAALQGLPGYRGFQVLSQNASRIRPGIPPAPGRC